MIMMTTVNPLRRPRTMPARGFTLIELMIVVVIIGVLAGIALPSYMEHVRKGRRVDAKTALLDLAARQERYFAVNNVYAATPLALGITSTAITSGNSATSYYTLDMSAPVGANGITTYSATATPTGPQLVDKCQKYSIDYLGRQTNVGATDTGCW